MVRAISDNTLESLRASYKEWSASAHAEAKAAASKRALEMAAKLNGRTVQEILSAETLDRLK